MWTLGFWAFVVTIMVLVLVYSLHRWIGIKRDDEATAPKRAPLLEKLLVWAKARWDFTAAALIALAPVLWSAGLDSIVIVANLLANVFPAIAGVDLSKLMIPDNVRTYIQIGAVALPPLRDAIEKIRGK